MVKPYLNQVGGKVENDVNLFTGGLNTYVDKAFVEPNQMPYVMNMTMFQPPMMCTRPSRYTWAKWFEPQVPGNSEEVIDMFAISGDDILLITRSGNTTTLTRYIRNNGVFVKQPVSGTMPTKDLYTFAYCQTGTHKYVYIGNETCKIRVDANSSNPLTIVDYNAPGDEAHYGLLCWHKGRLWTAKPSTNIIEWSNALDPDDYTTAPTGDSGQVYINTMKGSIQNIISFDDKLIVLCEHSIHAIYGDSGDATDVNYFQVVDLNNNLGCHSPTCVTVGGGKLFFLGDDYEVYEYTGASLNIISRPGTTRNSTLSVGGISNIFTSQSEIDMNRNAVMVATANRLYFNIGQDNNDILFIFDIYNRTWWCEDGEFTTIAVYSTYKNIIIMAKPNGDILFSYERPSMHVTNYGYDEEFDFDAGKIVLKPIKYEFHTRVYGADGLDMLKTITEVWFQASAKADVYLNDIWSSRDIWRQKYGDEWALPPIEGNYKKIGTLERKYQNTDMLNTYRPNTYEQQVCFVEKMYGQRLNAFQIIVKGEGGSMFYFMKRVWRAR